MSNFKHQIKINKKGFTLIELLLAISIVGILFGLTTISLANVRESTTISTSSELIIADLKSQQTKAMNGTDGGGNFGVHFSANNSYILFRGTSFDSTSPANSLVSVDENITFSAGDIIFSPVSGEVTNFIEVNPPIVTVTNSNGSAQKTIILNRYGVVVQD